MSDNLQHALPIVVAMLVILTIGVVQASSKTIAAITATMPTTIPLTLWIMRAAGTERAEMQDVVGNMFVGVGATLIFTAALWLASRAGLGLLGMLLVGYAAWAAFLGIHALIRAYVM